MNTLVAADTLIEVACPACGANRRRLLASEGTLGIAQCQRCRLVFTSPRLAHPQEHYLGERDSIMRKYGSILRANRHNRDANYDQELGVIAEIKPTGRLLDVGSHCGFFLRRARGMSWGSLVLSLLKCMRARSRVLRAEHRTGHRARPPFPTSRLTW